MVYIEPCLPQFPRTLSGCVMLEITQQASPSITAFSFVQLIPKTWVLSSCKMLCLEMSDLKRCVRQAACPQSIDSREGSDMEIKKDIVDSVTSENQDTRSGKARRSICPVSFVLVTFNFTAPQSSHLSSGNYNSTQLGCLLMFKWVNVD